MFSYPVLCAFFIGLLVAALGLGDSKLLREHFNWRLFSYVTGAFAVASLGLSGQQSVWYTSLLSEGYVSPGEVSALNAHVQELEAANRELESRAQAADAKWFESAVSRHAWPAVTSWFSLVEDDGERCYPLDEDFVLAFSHDPCYFRQRSLCAYPECPWCEE